MLCLSTPDFLFDQGPGKRYSWLQHHLNITAPRGDLLQAGRRRVRPVDSGEDRWWCKSDDLANEDDL